MSRGEFELIRQYFPESADDPGVLIGIGDDAAVVEVSGQIVIATDTLVEGTHFPRDTSPDVVGYRVLAVNLSDMAAMGAQPRWVTLALTIPDADEPWLESFSSGFYGLARRHEVSLVGGDLTRGPLSATVQIIGLAGPQGVLERSGGRIGDEVYVTGHPGDAAAGLSLITAGHADAGPAHRVLADRFNRPTPRVSAGLALAPVANAAIDVSDGLVADLGHICEASGCGAVVEVERLPVSTELVGLFPGDAARNFALTGGDDYELCFTAPRGSAAAVDSALAGAGVEFRRIGQLVAGVGVECRHADKVFQPAGAGHAHF